MSLSAFKKKGFCTPESIAHCPNHSETSTPPARGQEDGEDGLLQLPAGHEAVHEVEARALAHLVEREPEHTVEVEAREPE